VITIQPDSYLGYNTLGGIYNLLGLYNEAITMHKRAIEIYPNPASYANLGTDYFYLEKHDEAIDAYVSALKLDPLDDLLYRNLGDAYLRVGRTDEAEEQFKRASELLVERLRINPADARLLARLANCQAKLGRSQQALNGIERAVSSEPHNIELMYQHAVIYALVGRPDDAIAHLRKAIANGYSRSEAHRDPDLDSLRTHPDYEALSSAVDQKLP
jgi:eukaryotic-like serine/threonine-protein kinase